MCILLPLATPVSGLSVPPWCCLPHVRRCLSLQHLARRHVLRSFRLYHSMAGVFMLVWRAGATRLFRELPVQQAKSRTTSARCARPPTMCGTLCAVFSTLRCTSARCGPLRCCLRWHAQLLPVQSAPCSFLIHHAVWPLVHDADALSGPSHPFCTARYLLTLLSFFSP